MNSNEEWDIVDIENDENDEGTDDEGTDHDEEVEEEQEGEENEAAEVSESEVDEADENGDNDSDYVETSTVNADHFDFIKRLGTGAYGTVFMVKKNCGIDEGKVYALKVIAKDVVVEARKTIKHMKAERKVLELLRGCPYIPNLYYAFQTAEKLFIALDYVPGGEMFTLLQKSVLDEQRVRFYIAELIIALEHIHKHGIVYRDIKLENILIDADGHVKLVDFGLCKKLGQRGRTKSFCGTVEYMPPEVVNGTGHNTSADWWALGVLTIELLTGVTAFGSNEPSQSNDIMNRIVNNEPIMPQNISHDMEDFIRKMLHKDPTMRLGGSGEFAIDIKNHPLFKEIDWNKLEKKQLPAPDVPTITHPYDVQNFSEEFTNQSADYDSSAVPEDSFRTFRGYSYIAPDLDTSNSDELDNIDTTLNSLSLDVFSNRLPDSEFFKKYNFTSPNPLGIGTSSICLKCMNLTNNNFYAVKIYSRQDKCTNQITVLEKCTAKKFKGIVNLIEVLNDAKWTYVVLELIDGVNLLEHGNTIGLDGKYITETFNALWKIVKKVHSVKYSHGRISFKNIRCIKNSSEICLIGFSNAQPIKTFDGRIDFWSIGVCLYTLLCGHSPFTMLPSNIPEMVNSVADNTFNMESDKWIKLHENTKILIKKLIKNSNFTLNLRDMKSIVSETFPATINNVEQLVEENQKIISIRCEQSLNSLNGSVSSNAENDSLHDNGVAILENGTNSIESPVTKHSVVPVTLPSEEIHSIEEQSQNGDNKPHSDTENIRKRLKRSKRANNDVDLSLEQPLAKLKKSVIVNESILDTEPKLTEEVSGKKTKGRHIANGESNGHAQVENSSGTSRKLRNREAFVPNAIKVETTDTLVNDDGRPSSISSYNNDVSLRQSNSEVIKQEFDIRKSQSRSRGRKWIATVTRKSSRLAQPVQTSKSSTISTNQIKKTEPNTKRSKKKPPSKIKHTTYSNERKIDQRVENSEYGVREYQQFVYKWPMRKREPLNYVFERYNY